MPNQLKHRCGMRGCPQTTRHRYCDEHRPLAQRLLDKRRGLPAERGYDRAWKQIALARRRLDFYLCQDCLAHDMVVSSNLVDHIVPIHVRPDWRLEIDNTQVLCTACHGRKSGQDLVRFGGRGPVALNNLQRRNRAEVQRLAAPPRAAEEVEE